MITAAYISKVTPASEVLTAAMSVQSQSVRKYQGRKVSKGMLFILNFKNICKLISALEIEMRQIKS
jgi:hypothetical protein